MRSLVVALTIALVIAAASAFASDQGVEPESGAPFAVTAGGRAVAVQEISAPVVRLKGRDAQPYWYAQSIVSTLTRSKEAGRLRGCTLRNIHIANPFDAETMRVHLEAADAAHPIEGVVFDDVTGYGRVSAVRTSAPSSRQRRQ